MGTKLKGLTAVFTLATVFLAVSYFKPVNGQWDPHFTENRTTIVHLFEWRWNDIAEECERFLGPYGFGGVQTSPPNENVVADKEGKIRPWWERYQPVSYNLETRSGSEQEFASMAKRCNAVGVRIYIDAVINHMTYFQYWGSGTGTNGSWYDSTALNYTGVPYSNLDFNGANDCPTDSGEIENYGDAIQVRNCRLGRLNDLNHGKEWVRERIIDYLNKLVGFGVAGFRVDASKHMWPGDMEVIFSRVNSLPVEHDFPSGSRPFIFQEVIDNGGEAISANEYFGIGRVTEFKGCSNIGTVLRKWDSEFGAPQQLRYLKTWGPGEGSTGWGFIPDASALTFVDNHDNQRGHGSGGASILSFRESKLYKMAQAFFLSWPYGVTRVMSSYYWDKNPDENGNDLNDWVGPPHDPGYNTLPVTVFPNMTCGNGWMCEHRWRQIYNMVRFRNVAKGTDVNLWWDNGKDQIAFSRGNSGFIAINNDDVPLNAAIPTGLPPGLYCDVISGNLENDDCTGKVIRVDSQGVTSLYIPNELIGDQDPMVAIHIESRLP